ncbi:MAG: DUF1449 family protein [Verrucomicrobia bacterium]|nr:DUF1449 family protein [Verrucomicrobiota bacterium]MCH8526353.1 DUF1449 family protein [Kiritimatiellia bacterium]
MSSLIEFYHAAFHVVNLPATLLLLLVVIYWLTVIFGVMDLSSLDLDLPEIEFEGDAGPEAAHTAFDAFFEYFNIKYVPISIFVSFFALSFWVTGMIANEMLGSRAVPLIGLAVFGVNLVFSAHAAKVITLPMVPLFKQMQKDVSARRDLIGSRVVVTSSKADAVFGQAEIVDEGAPITLNVRTEGEEISKGSEAVILQHQTERDIYIITPMEY